MHFPVLEASAFIGALDHRLKATLHQLAVESHILAAKKLKLPLCGRNRGYLKVGHESTSTALQT